MSSTHPPLLAVTTVGADQPGIIARVTGVLLEHDGNIADSTMTVLGGHFAILLLVSTPADPAALHDALTRATADLGLLVSVGEVGAGAGVQAPTHVLTVYGTDRPGLIHGVATALAERGVNVTDLETRLLEGAEPTYAMVFEVTIPPGVDPEEVRAAARASGDGLEASLHAVDVAAL